MTDDDLKSIRRELISDGFECQGPRTFAGIPFALTAVRRRRAWSWLAWATRSFEDFYLFADFADLDADELLAFLTVCRAWAAPDARRLPILSQLRWPWVRRVYCVAMASRPTQGVLIHVRETPPLTADDNCTLIPVIYDSRRQETHLFRKLHLPPNLQLDH